MRTIQPRYYVETWCPARQEYTKQNGVPHVVPRRKLRHALRLLQSCGYIARKGDSFVYVSRVEAKP